MSRTKMKARKLGTPLRERNRDLSKSQHQDLADSKQLPRKCPPRDKFKRKARLANKAKLRHAKHIQGRAALMNTKLTKIHDLRHVDSDELGKDCEHYEPQNTSRDFKVLFHAGFLGYQNCTESCGKMVEVGSFNSLVKLARILMKLLSSQLQYKLGLKQEMYEVAGYELCFAEDFVCGEVVVQAGQTVLVRSEYILSAWAEQAYKHWRYNDSRVVVRIVKPGGEPFDPTFRTPKEIETAHQSDRLAKQFSTPSTTPQGLIGLGIQDDILRIAAVEKQKAQRRNAKRQHKQGGQMTLDTDYIERLMERQHLSDSIGDAQNFEDDGLEIPLDPQADAECSDIAASNPSVVCHLTEQNEMDLD